MTPVTPVTPGTGERPAALRLLGLPLLAVVLVAAVLGVQWADGGGSFRPLEPADPCADRPAVERADSIDALTEQLVLLGVADAACTLGVTREALVLELAAGGDRSDEEVDALREGLRSAVRRLAEDDALPPASALVDEALDAADLNPLLEAGLRALPDSVVDGALDTEDVLLRAVDELDLRALLADLDDPDELTGQVRGAVSQAVRDALLDRLRNLV